MRIRRYGACHCMKKFLIRSTVWTVLIACRSLGPRLTDRDIEKIAQYLRIKPHEVVAKYLRIDEDNDYVFKEMPCPFLCADNYCSIYESRPKACREYPHTDRKKFFQVYALSIRNAETCPAVFEILQRLRQKFRK